MSLSMTDLITTLHSETSAFLAWLLAGGSVGSLVFYKVRRSNSNDKQATEQQDSMTDVLTHLRAEITRLSEQNEKLAIAVNRLQLEVIGLRHENAALQRSVENSKW